MRSCFPVRTVSILVFCLLLLLVISHTALAKSQAAPANYAAGDIQFCPKGKPYGHINCSPVTGSMATAITNARDAAALGVSGTIYLESGDYGGAVMSVTGFTYGTSLTIQGGVNGGTTVFTRQLYLSGNDLDLTLQNVVLDHSAAAEDGLYTFGNTGDLILQNVYTAIDNGTGIYIYNQTGNVSLTNVNANGNGVAGVVLWMIDGEVKLNSVYANSNGSTNLVVQEVTGSLVMDDVAAGSSIAGYGIYIQDIQGKKGVIMSNVNANSNAWTNTDIHTITSNVSLTNVDAHSSTGVNDNYGVYINDVQGSKGVTLKQVAAHSNVDGNIIIQNIVGSTSLTDIGANSGYFGVYCTNITGSKGVTMKNVTANSNAWDNVNVYDIAGSVSMNNVQAHGSTNERGVTIQAVDGRKGVVLKEIHANSNGLTNLNIDDIEGNVTATTVEANGSSANFGVFIQNVRGSKGVTLKDITAHSNTTGGVRLNNIYNNVSLSGFNSNSNGAHGIEVTAVGGSKGVTLKGGYSLGNNYHNIYVHNIVGNADLSGVATHSSATESGIWVEDIYGLKGATLKNIVSESNSVYGVAVVNVPNGNASLSGVQTLASGSNGIHIDTILGTKGVSLKGIISNDQVDVNVYVSNIVGNVDLKQVQANGSLLDVGIWVTTIGGSKGVTMKDVVANGNAAPNIVISTVEANVNLGKIQAEYSGNNGIFIDTIHGTKGVYLKDVIANSNNTDNIAVGNIDLGNVVLNKVTANGSVSGRGFYTINVVGEVMVMNSFFNDNQTNGLMTLNVTGLILLKGVQGNDNNNDGANLSSDSNQLVCSSELINNTDFSIHSTTTGDSLTFSKVIYDNYMLTGTFWFESTKCKVIPPP